MRVLLVLLALAACGDGFSDVQKVDTIDAYEAFIRENPASPKMLMATTRLEELYLKRADEDKSLAAYDVYLTRFPEGAYREKAMAAREQFLFDDARAKNTAESWQAFLTEYPRAKKENRLMAERMLAVAGYRDALVVGAVEKKQINLAEDPEGPLNGWGFFVPVTNAGDRKLKDLRLTIEYLDATGRTLDRDEWPVVAENFGVPMEEEKLVPMKPRETRTWEWTTGELPDGWADARVYPSRVVFSE